jgi:hypothetical protein
MLTFRIALGVAAVTAVVAGNAGAQTPPIDPAREMREMRVARIMIDNLFDDARAALTSDDCARFEKLKAQLSSFSESPNAIAAAIGSGPNEISLEKLIELSSMAGARREVLRQQCPRTAATSQPGQGTSTQTAGSGGTGSSPPPAKTPVIIMTGIDKNGAWLSGDFGHTRTYVKTMETTHHNPVVDDDELPPPVVECSDGRCRLNEARIKAATAGQGGAKNQKGAPAATGEAEQTTKGAVKGAAKGAPTKAADGGSEKATKSGSGAASEGTKSSGQGASGGGKEIGMVKPVDVPPVQTAAAMAWLFLGEKFDSPMTQVDPPKLNVDGPQVSMQQGGDQMKVVDAAQALMRDAYTAALDGVVHDDFAVYVMRHAMSDAGIALMSAQTVGRPIQLTPEQLALIRNFGGTRIKDLQLATPDSQAGAQTGGGKSGKQSSGSGKTPAKTSKTTKTPTQTSKAPAAGNEAASQLGQQILQGVIQGGIQYGIGRALDGGDDRRSHQNNATAVKRGKAQTVKSPTTTAKPSGGSATSGPILFQGYTYPQR